MNTNKQVVVARTYKKARERLRDYHEPIDEKFEQFWRNPQHPSLRLHRLERIGHGDWWSYYVNKDIRTIVSDQQDCWVVCYVGHHKVAYQWAERHRFTTDLTRGSYSLAPPVSEVREAFVEASPPKRSPRRPLSRCTAEQIMRLGIPNRDWAEHLIQATEEQLLQILQQALDEGWFPEDVIERLYDLALDARPCKELLPPELSVLMPSELFRRRPRDFWTPESEQEIRKAIQGGWQEWIIFLHSLQKEAVERDLRGAIRIGGGAGTGKTVLAAHRTAYLATRYPDERILLTTFTRVLAENLKQRVEQIIGPIAGTRIEVNNLHAVAYHLFKQEIGRRENIVEEEEKENTDALLAEAIKRAGSGYAISFVRPEWETIIDRWNVRTLDAYLEIERLGRKAPLQPAQREKLWPVFEQMWCLLEERRKVTYSSVCYAVAEYLAQHPEKRYRCVVVDEAQDFGPAELSLISVLVQQDRENSLFLCADSRQRIYRPAIPWIRFGIDTRGRSHTLRVNYRTTRQIQDFAERVLPREIEGSQEDEKSILAVRPFALLQGAHPEVHGYENIPAEMRGLKQWIYQCLDKNIQPGEIAVFARGKRTLSDVENLLEEILKERSVRARKLSRKQQPVPHELNYGTAHNAKGLEFCAVAIVGVTASNFPSYAALKDVTDSAEREAIVNRERQLLYTVCTRARERLYISYAPTTRPSPFLPTAR